MNDGLGSVRQLADGDGDVTLAQGYTPFGVLLWREGDAASGYGFTGEQEDVAVGLVFLRARYYDPATGRFVSKDSWFGDSHRPVSLHAYLYTKANPTNLVDLLGLYAQACLYDDNAYNLTDWLVREMHHQSNHWPVRGGIDTLVTLGRLFDYLGGSILPQDVTLALLRDALIPYFPGRALGVPSKGLALFWWAQMVGDKLRWDFKHKIKRTFGEYIVLCDDKESGWYEYSMPGNIFYAYVGRVAGFTELDIRLGAIYAQQRDPNNDPALNDWFLGLDQASDQAALELGFDMYKSTRGSSSETVVRHAFKEALAQHKDRLAQGSGPTKIYELAPGTPLGPDGPKFELGAFDGENVMGWLGR